MKGISSHFRFADEAAFKQGKQIALLSFKNYLRPMNGGESVGSTVITSVAGARALAVRK